MRGLPVTQPPPNQPSDDDRPATTVSLEAFTALLAEDKLLQSRIAELERRLGLDSSNSGKLPSSDGLKKKPSRVRSLRERSEESAAPRRAPRRDPAAGRDVSTAQKQRWDILQTLMHGPAHILRTA